MSTTCTSYYNETGACEHCRETATFVNADRVVTTTGGHLQTEGYTGPSASAPEWVWTDSTARVRLSA